MRFNSYRFEINYNYLLKYFMNLKIYPYQADRNKGFSASSKSDLSIRSLIENPSKDERCRYHNQRPMIAINSML